MSKLFSKTLPLRKFNYQNYKLTSVDLKTTNKTPEPIIINYDIIGQPDKNSNLRPVKIYVPSQESALEKQYRELRNETQDWNQIFWSEHNQRFLKERERYISANKSEDDTPLNADQMSVFYKDFLDSNWKNHVAYNIEWYKRNIQILGLAARVHLVNLVKKIVKS